LQVLARFLHYSQLPQSGPQLEHGSELLDELDNLFPISLFKLAAVFTQCSFLLWRLQVISPLNQNPSFSHRSASKLFEAQQSTACVRFQLDKQQ
jgi:hypothetical protein